MKKLLLAICILLMFLANANAQFRIDAAITVPAYVGNFSGLDLVQIPYFIPVPELGLYYQFDLDMIKIGAGFRIPSVIIMNLLMPDAFIELFLDPFIARFSVCGGMFVPFGLLKQLISELGGDTSQILYFEPIFLPDISVGVRLWNVLQLTAGCFFWVNLEYPEHNYYVPYVGFRLVFVIGGEKS